MTELTQPLVAAPAETTAIAERATTTLSVSFSELVCAHFDWWQNRSQSATNGRTSSAYEAALSAGAVT